MVSRLLQGKSAISKRMSDEQINFKVTDRRLFNADGTPRDIPLDEKPDPIANAAGASSETANETHASVPLEDSRGSEFDPERDEELNLPDADDPASFVNFLMSIASNAAMALGVMEHPVTHKREVDLQLAKHWIDVLGMLERKTRGNLTPQEEKIVGGLLADMRLQYVSMVEAGPPKASRTYSGSDITGGR